PRQAAILERLPLPPPAIPKPPQVCVRSSASQFIRQQPAHAQQSRLERQRRQGCAFGTNSRAQLSQALHRPQIMFVAQGTEQPLPERLLPASLSSPGLKQRRLALEPNESGLPQQFTELLRRQLPQRSATLTEQFDRKRTRHV